MLTANSKTYQIDTLETDKLLYIDRSFDFTTIPNQYIGAEYIRTANDDKDVTDTNFLTFTLMSSATVYVIYDDRVTALPDWLSQWSLAPELIQTSDGTRRVYKKSFPAGLVSLGGNAAPPMTGAESNYNVFALADNGQYLPAKVFLPLVTK